STDAVHGRSARAEGISVSVPRGRSRRLDRRAGGGGRRREPVARSRRGRPDRGRVRIVAGGLRPRACAWARGSARPSRIRHQSGMADLIEVEYESLPAVSDPERALGPGAPLVHPEFGTNQAFSFPMKGGDVNAAFARAAHVARVRVEHNRLAGAPMEPRGVVARYDPGTGELTLWLTTQNPFTTRADLASVLDYPEHKLRLVALDVGGG